MNWGAEDFLAAAAILVAVGLGVLLVSRTIHSQPARGLLMAIVVIAALALWAHLAVGIF
ncbi:hypothetical protein QBK99_22220 [Corticibacterium sp. UT-5YL-CI-8]|nr:hypothetical protein [Tianweitania sp. UT-5YL-CI-8]